MYWSQFSPVDNRSLRVSTTFTLCIHVSMLAPGDSCPLGFLTLHRVSHNEEGRPTDQIGYCKMVVGGFRGSTMRDIVASILLPLRSLAPRVVSCHVMRILKQFTNTHTGGGSEASCQQPFPCDPSWKQILYPSQTFSWCSPSWYLTYYPKTDPEPKPSGQAAPDFLTHGCCVR